MGRLIEKQPPQTVQVRAAPELSRLPLVTLHITDRCNSRCVSCDYWRHGRDDMTLESISRLMPSFRDLGTRVVLVSGGEPFLNPEWAAIAELLRREGLKVWLLTSGLALAKNARRAAELFDTVTVSLDGCDAQTYRAIRGLDAFDKVCEGIAALADAGLAPSIRVTLQQRNFRQLPRFVDLAHTLGARSVSFLAVDVANPHAFGRAGDFSSDLALREEDVSELDRILCSMELERQADFATGFIEESAQKLRKLQRYFAAVRGLEDYPPVRCNAPEFSAVIGAAGQVHPCFFISGADESRLHTADSALPADALAGALNAPAMVMLRAAIRDGDRPECKTCVCSLWREADEFGSPVRDTGSIATVLA